MIARVDCDGVPIAVRDWAAPPNEPPPVVLLHGFTGNAETMAGIAATLTRRRVLAPDLIGHGQSASPPELSPYTMDSCVTQVLRSLSELGVQHCDLLGYSMGARVALSLAATEPQFVRSLILVGGTPGIADAAAREKRRAADAALADRIEREGVAAFADAWMAQPLFESQARLGAAALAQAREQRLANDAVGLANSLRGMGTGSMRPLFDDLGDIAAPTWWIHGAEDTKFGAIARASSAAMPRAQVVSVANAGHAAHLENPTAVAEIVAIAFNPPRFPV